MAFDHPTKSMIQVQDLKETIQSSIVRSRTLLIAISLAASWLIANDIQSLIKWQSLRISVSSNLSSGFDRWLDSTDGGWISIAFADLKPSERAEALKESPSPNRIRFRDRARFLESPDSARLKTLLEIRYPVGKNIAAKIEWIQRYQPFVLEHSDTTFANVCRLLIDRGRMSTGVLPDYDVGNPYTTIPIIGTSVDSEDATIILGIVIAAGMLWHLLSIHNIKENVLELLNSTEYSDKPHTRNWVSLQFLLISNTASRSNAQRHSAGRLAFPLYFLPYVAILFSILANLYMVIWKTAAYSIATATPLAPWIGDGESWFSQEALGIMTLRYGILLLLLWNIGVIGWRAWHELIEISDTLGHSPIDQSISRRRIRRISAIPFIIMGTFMITRLWHLDDRVNSVGWTYGPTFIGSLVILVVVYIIHYWIHRSLRGAIWRQRTGTIDHRTMKRIARKVLRRR